MKAYTEARARRIRALRPPQTLRLCALCGEVVPPSAEHVDLHLRDLSTGAALSLFWHIGCAVEDPHHMRLADLDAEDAGTEGHNERFTVAVRETRDAIVERLGELGLRGALHIKRDIPGRSTLRNPSAWGLVSRRS